jgi:hypothetical protein
MILLCGDARLASALLSSRHTHAGPVSKTECRSLSLCGGRCALLTALAPSSQCRMESRAWDTGRRGQGISSSYRLARLGRCIKTMAHRVRQRARVVATPYPVDATRHITYEYVSRRDEQLASLRVLRVLALHLKTGANTMPAQHPYAFEGYRGVSYHAILAV